MLGSEGDVQRRRPRESDDRMTRDTLRKLHSFTGLFPLGTYLLFHAYEHLAARQGRDAVLDRILAAPR